MAPSTTPLSETVQSDKSETVHIQPSAPYLSAKEMATAISLHSKPAPSNSAALVIQAYSLLRSLADELRFPIRTIGTAMILYHRYTLLHKEGRQHRTDVIAIAALFLACKLTDCAKSLTVIISTTVNGASAQLEGAV
jgi:CTD kinase subunit beta